MPRATTKQKTRPKSGGRVPPPFQVFISHSSHDSWIAGQIGKEIEALGATTLLDKHFLRGGDDVRERIIEEIRESTEVIVLLSPESQKSQWVSTEVGLALGQRKRVTPILHNVRPKGMMGPLQGIKAIYLNDFDSFLIELSQRINKWIDRKRE